MLTKIINYGCFNPCFNGIYSQTQAKRFTADSGFRVSILVLMEFTRKPAALTIPEMLGISFNPCFNGIYSQTFIALFNENV